MVTSDSAVNPGFSSVPKSYGTGLSSATRSKDIRFYVSETLICQWAEGELLGWFVSSLNTFSYNNVQFTKQLWKSNKWPQKNIHWPCHYQSFLSWNSRHLWIGDPGKLDLLGHVHCVLIIGSCQFPRLQISPFPEWKCYFACKSWAVLFLSPLLNFLCLSFPLLMMHISTSQAEEESCFVLHNFILWKKDTLSK